VSDIDKIKDALDYVMNRIIEFDTEIREHYGLPSFEESVVKMKGEKEAQKILDFAFGPGRVKAVADTK